jgi:hypothetical protein
MAKGAVKLVRPFLSVIIVTYNSQGLHWRVPEKR